MAESHCSKNKLQQELDSIRSILQRNDYPKVIINSTISKKMSVLSTCQKNPQKCPVHLKLPWIGNMLLKFEKQVKSNVQNCFPAVEPRVIFQTRKILPQFTRMLCPSHYKAWLYTNTCAAVIVGTWVAHRAYEKGGQGETMSPGPMEFRGPMSSRGGPSK